MVDFSKESHGFLVTVPQRDFFFIALLLVVGLITIFVSFYGYEHVFLFPMLVMFIWFLFSIVRIGAALISLSVPIAEDSEMPERLAGTIIPPSFTALGILFTFLGLPYGLSDFSTDPDKLLASIGTLVSGTKTAFLSSVCGISLSVLTSQLYQFGWKVYEDKKQRLILKSYMSNSTSVGAASLLMDKPELALAMLLR